MNKIIISNCTDLSLSGVVKHIASIKSSSIDEIGSKSSPNGFILTFGNDYEVKFVLNAIPTKYGVRFVITKEEQE